MNTITVKKYYFIIIALFYLTNAKGDQSRLNKFVQENWSLSKTQLLNLKQHKVVSDATVSDKAGQQTFEMKVMAMHKKRCRKAIRKLSLLEEYEKWIDFIKSSKYQEQSHLYTILADHPLLPYRMRIHIIVERPTKPGRYTFTFPTGMFVGLRGHFIIKEVDKKCLFYAQSYWIGRPTKIPNFAIEIFSETLSRIGGEVLMRKSQ